MNAQLRAALKEHCRSIAKIGGSSKSDRKRAASAANARKATAVRLSASATQPTPVNPSYAS